MCVPWCTALSLQEKKARKIAKRIAKKQASIAAAEKLRERQTEELVSALEQLNAGDWEATKQFPVAYGVKMDLRRAQAMDPDELERLKKKSLAMDQVGVLSGFGYAAAIGSMGCGGG
jgi:hypothetical protein